MKVIKDKYVTNCARHTKVEFDNKNFRRFYFGYKGRTAEILWLSNEREFIGMISDGYFIDIGIPTDYEKAQTELPALKFG